MKGEREIPQTAMSNKFPHLFEPIVLGKRFFKNRIFYSPTGYKEQPVDEAACYYERKALRWLRTGSPAPTSSGWT